jgi:hypothetical protein
MRILFACLAAAGLLGGVIGCECIHGKCDCDDGYGCACCPNYGGAGPVGIGLPVAPAPAAPPAVPPEPLPPPK